ncbi:hypothetical protein N5U04_02795 [Aliarcobacter butzleri]|uniref:hypothetical protein n=2 Tax=Aliarcobacter butzleri TaxID=28197 RepID=UPI0021B3EE24|nr:hypothetical protein [Aliarcobacter butzleri]MCT7549189.1 hypothetical protein [Aliarcobacter butzleri]MCT7553700.1 hypothetical protein [Aliarcobacter butzleri]MCT7557534.1 hypothetical protein [Aliarcobacter butzleri]MCT7558499.1 hypothetical protein [Aliarcobacter butzleri]
MTYSTEIDTVSIQVNCSSLEEQQGISFMVGRAITEYNKVCILDNIFTKEKDILFNSNRLGTIRLGINPIWNKFTRQYDMNYYVAVSFCGLKSHIEILDNLSNGCLFAVCGILNTFNFNYVFTELDVCLDMNIKMDNILAICTTKLPRTEYHLLNNSFYNGDTVYIEKISKDRINYNSQRAYVYNKAKKENLQYPLTRFELKLQKSFFKNDLDFETIVNALNRYTVMFFPTIYEKIRIVDKYNSYSRISRRDIDRIGLDRYRLKPDVVKIERFIDNLKKYRLY